MRPLAEAKLSKAKLKSFLRFRSRKLEGVSTGLPGLDEYLLGLGGLTIIQGETGRKKSILGLQIVHHNLKLGHPCVMLDKENGEGRVQLRLMCQAQRRSFTDIKVASDADIDVWHAGISEYPLYLYTEPIRDFDKIKESLVECWRIHKKPLILFGDALQGMTPVDQDQRVSLEKWLVFFDEMKLLFDGKLTVLLTSEKSRSGYSNDGIGAAKGTNQVEYKSETLLDIRDSNTPDAVILKVIKNRDGDKGKSFELRNVLADPLNPTSFCFLLEDAPEAPAL